MPNQIARHMPGRFYAALFALALMAGGALPAMAADIVSERQSIMKENSGHMRAIGAFLKGGPRAGTAADLALRGEALAHSAKRVPSLFPKGTGIGQSEVKNGAKLVIWEDWAGFEAEAAALEAEAQKLIAAAKSGDKDAIKASMASLGRNGCGGCHRKFRQKEKM